MKQIETSLALPVRQLVNPVQMAGGAAIIMAGSVLAMTHILPLI